MTVSTQKRGIFDVQINNDRGGRDFKAHSYMAYLETSIRFIIVLT